MSTDLLVILDDNSDAFRYTSSGGSNPWILSTLTQFYKSTSWYPESTATSIGGFTFTFNGTSVAFIGNTPPSDSPQTATVQIDNGTSFVINYEDPNPQSYKQWFTTPTLPDGRHTITMTDLYLIALDYAVVTVGSHTSLAGQTVIVDNDSSLIHYSGRWSRSTEKFVPGFLPTGNPYGNSTHRSSNPGDTFTFRFSGTSIAVYGLFSWYKLGSLTVTYSIDGTPYSSLPVSVTTSSISVTPSSPNYLRNDGDFSNYLYFGLDSLPSGSHTLLVNITEAKNQTFMLDYITYKPSFGTLSSMPTLSNVSSGTTQSGVTATSSASSRPQRSLSTGAIVGCVIGGLAFGVLVTILAILFRRRAREKDYAYHDATLVSSINHSNYAYPPSSFELQESLSYRPQPANRSISPFTLPDSQRHQGADVKHVVLSHSATGPHRNTTPIPGNSTGVEQPILDPPAYDTISDRVSRQP